jgi:hypothetical protein
MALPASVPVVDDDGGIAYEPTLRAEVSKEARVLAAGIPRSAIRTADGKLTPVRKWRSIALGIAIGAMCGIGLTALEWTFLV